MRKRVTWEGGYLIVRSGTVTDELNAQIMAAQLMKLETDPTALGFWQTFADLCVQTEESEGLIFKPENVRNLPLLDKQSAYNAYLRMPTTIRKKWSSALKAVNNEDGVIIEDVVDDPKP